MDEKARRRIAFIVANKAGLTGDSLYSFDAEKFTSMEKSGSTSYYDFESGTFFEDDYDFDSGAFWEVNQKNNSFDGYHFGFGDFFECVVNNSEIEFYDFGTGRFHNFQLS